MTSTTPLPNNASLMPAHIEYLGNALYEEVFEEAYEQVQKAVEKEAVLIEWVNTQTRHTLAYWGREIMNNTLLLSSWQTAEKAAKLLSLFPIMVGVTVYTTIFNGKRAYWLAEEKGNKNSYADNVVFSVRKGIVMYSCLPQPEDEEGL